MCYGEGSENLVKWLTFGSVAQEPPSHLASWVGGWGNEEKSAELIHWPTFGSVAYKHHPNNWHRLGGELVSRREHNFERFSASSPHVASPDPIDQ